MEYFEGNIEPALEKRFEFYIKRAEEAGSKRLASAIKKAAEEFRKPRTLLEKQFLLMVFNLGGPNRLTEERQFAEYLKKGPSVYSRPVGRDSALADARFALHAIAFASKIDIEKVFDDCRKGPKEAVPKKRTRFFLKTKSPDSSGTSEHVFSLSIDSEIKGYLEFMNHRNPDRIGSGEKLPPRLAITDWNHVLDGGMISEPRSKHFDLQKLHYLFGELLAAASSRGRIIALGSQHGYSLRTEHAKSALDETPNKLGWKAYPSLEERHSEKGLNYMFSKKINIRELLEKFGKRPKPK